MAIGVCGNVKLNNATTFKNLGLWKPCRESTFDFVNIVLFASVL